MEITRELCILEKKVRFATENGRQGLCDKNDCFFMWFKITIKNKIQRLQIKIKGKTC